ncbi:MAG: hypothetical protein INR69_02235 [Mucilaginibacter polytrichastri]|nr:hypothetical protein [Mucilaginibacter polytrichastri]
MKPFSPAIFACFLCMPAMAQFTGARFSATAGSGAALSDVWSVSLNPAGLAWLETGTAAVNYENLYFTPGLGVASAALALPFSGRNVIGSFVSVFGTDSYRELNAAFAYARRFGDRLSAAVTLHFHQLAISGYGSTNGFSADAGLQYRAGEKLYFGISLKNIGENGYSSRDAAVPVPRVLTFGGAYRFSEQVQWSADLDSSEKQALSLRTGLSYFLVSSFALRGGIRTQPFSQFAGFGFNWKNMSLNAACSAHPTLGYSPAFGLDYAF